MPVSSPLEDGYRCPAVQPSKRDRAGNLMAAVVVV